VVQVFFATDRSLTGKTNAAQRFGDFPSTLSYGTCEVSIPREHRMGELESPSILKFEFRENPAKHVMLLDATLQPKDAYFAGLAARVRVSARDSAFVFVHGYNVSFEGAARRTAQMSYDLGFDGAPVFYSWPSRGQTLAYTIDEQSIELAEDNMKAFLSDFFARSDAKNVYLIAHSMGTRALTRAVAALMTEQPELRPRLKEIILAAPDIDARVFKTRIAPALVAAGRPVTLYASSKDLALVASKRVHGYARAGDSKSDLLVLPGVETIDASAVDTSLLGHSYFAEENSVLSDLFYLVKDGKRADERFRLRGVNGPSGRYWQFRR